MKEILKKCAEKLVYTAYYPYARITIGKLYNKEHKNGTLRHLSNSDFNAWKAGMFGIIKEHCTSNFGFGTRLVYETFAKANINVVRCREYKNRELPIVVLCVKDDLKRLQMLVNHYRKLGIERFAFLDNGSPKKSSNRSSPKMLGNISHSSISSFNPLRGDRQLLLPSYMCSFRSIRLSTFSLPQEQLQYTTIFSTVNRRVLKFTKEAMFVHSLVKIAQYSKKRRRDGMSRRHLDPNFRCF